MKRLTFILMAAFLAAGAFAQNKQEEQETQPLPKTAAQEAVVELETTMGNVVILLYDDTPIHRDNFLRLAESGFYDGVLFHRVISDFMVQTGDPSSKGAPSGKMLGDGTPGYDLDAEIIYPKHFHKRGVLGAAREGDEVNPQRKSSGSQFYIVEGRKFTEGQLEAQMKRNFERRLKARFGELVKEKAQTIDSLIRTDNKAGLEELRLQLKERTEKDVTPVELPAEIKEAYMTQGGTPHLDGAYTVFGEVLSGMDVIDKIQKVATDNNDRPLEDVRIISVKVLKKPAENRTY